MQRSNGRDIRVGCTKNTDVFVMSASITDVPAHVHLIKNDNRVCVDDGTKGVGLLEPEDVSKSLSSTCQSFASLQVLECLEGHSSQSIVSSLQLQHVEVHLSVSRRARRSPNTVRQYSQRAQLICHGAHKPDTCYHKAQ
jgi:hypothetical protein